MLSRRGLEPEIIVSSEGAPLVEQQHVEAVAARA